MFTRAYDPDRYDAHKDWMVDIAAEGVSGGLPERGVADLIYPTALDIEYAHLTGEHMGGKLWDKNKMFDYFIRAINNSILLAAGADPG